MHVHGDPQRVSARRRRQVGLALIDALLAMLVTGLGALAVVSLQTSLSGHAELAGQRSQALRLAQARMEALRAAASLVEGSDPAGSGPAAAGPVMPTPVLRGGAGLPDPGFEVAAALGGAASDPVRVAEVTVRWFDRHAPAVDPAQGATAYNRQLRLSSVIAAGGVRQAGSLAHPPTPSQRLRRPGGRSPAIPPQAIALGGGLSALRLSADLVAVLDDLTGEMVQACDPGAAATADRIRALAAAGGCPALRGLLVSGYIGRTSPDLPWPSGIVVDGVARHSGVAGWDIRCSLMDTVDPQTGGPLTEGFGSKYYVCVIPLQAPHTWSGALSLGGLPADGDLLVCRHQLLLASVSANEANAQPYVGVSTSLRGQNYLLAHAGGGGCPASMNAAGRAIGVVHQDCRATHRSAPTPGLTTACPAASPPATP